MHGLPPKNGKGLGHIGHGERFIGDIMDKIKSANGTLRPPVPAPPAPALTDPSVIAALDISQPLTPAQADHRAANLLGFLNTSHLILRPSEVSPSDAGSRMGFYRVLSRFGSAIGMPGITVGAFPDHGPRMGRPTSRFIEVRLPQDDRPFFPAPVLLALETHLQALDFIQTPIHFTVEKDGAPVDAPFAEPWANDLLREINSL